MAKTEIKFAFKTADSNAILWPCTIKVPLAGGTFQDQVLSARFKVLAEGRLDYFYPSARALLGEVEKIAAGVAAKPQAAAEGDAPAPTTPARRGNAGLLDEALLGLVDVPGAEGKSEAYTAAALRDLPYVSDGLVAGYMEMIGRRLEKN